MTQIVGIRDGHRYLITVTGRAGSTTVDRRHHPDCPGTHRTQSARAARRRKPTCR